MSDNNKKDKDSKIGGIKSTQETHNVEGTKGVGDVSSVKGATGIGSIGGADGIGKRRATRTMTLEEREEIFKMVHEEAGKLFGKSGIPKEKQSILEDAVKMAIDSGLLGEEEEESKNSKKPRK